MTAADHLADPKELMLKLEMWAEDRVLNSLKDGPLSLEGIVQSVAANGIPYGADYGLVGAAVFRVLEIYTEGPKATIREVEDGEFYELVG